MTTLPPTPPSSTRSRSCARHPRESRHGAEQSREEDFRIAAVDAAVAAATVEIPDEIVTGRAGERWERMERQLAQQGMDPNVFLQMQGKRATS